MAGTNLPHTTILSVVEETSSDVLCSSTTLLANLPSAAELVESVRTRLKERAPELCSAEHLIGWHSGSPRPSFLPR
jgi:hypothetical protein